eukprot:56880_1
MSSFFKSIFLVVTTIIITTESQNYIYNGDYELSHSNWEDTCLFYYDQYLASIHNESQQLDAQNTTHNNAWIGLSDSKTENQWIWSDLTPFNYGTTYFVPPWSENEPNNDTTSEDCVHIYSGNGHWNDVDCSTHNYYGLCGYPKPFTAVNDKSNYIRTLSNGNIIGNIDILDEIYIDFYITFISWPIGLGSILHLGNDDNKRYPAIFIDGNSKNIQTSFGTINNFNPSHNTTYNYSLNTEYHYTLYQTQKHLTITFSDNYIYDSDTISHPIIMNQTIWLGNSFINNSFDAIIRNLKITTFNSPETRFWNYICDWYNRWTINNGGNWVYGAEDSDCSIRQSNIGIGIGRVAWIGVNDENSLNWNDYKIEFKIRFISGHEAGPIFRAHNANCDTNDCGQYYQLQIRADRMIFAKFNNGRTELGNDYIITTAS